MTMHLGEKISHLRVLRPFIVYGKKHLYNIYRRTKLIETYFPRQIWIENTNYCNARCIMCPREKHTRIRGVMDFFLFEKLIKEISHFIDVIDRVHLHNFGEPLLDRHLTRRIRLAKDYGIKHTYFVTNGSMLTQDASEDIIKSGLDEMKVSFYGTDPQTYNQTMVGLDFHKTLANLAKFFEIRKSLGRRNPRVILQYLPVETNKSRVDDFFSLLGPFIDKNIGDSFNIFSLHNYGDGRSYLKVRETTRICPFPWNLMVILYNGSVVPCCYDYNGKQIVGDVTTNTIRQIWQGEAYMKIRKNFKALRYQDYPICKGCVAARDTE